MNEYLVQYDFRDQEGGIVSAAEPVKAGDLMEATTKGEDLVIGRLILDPRVVKISEPRVRLLRIHSWR